jgi:hypothetical protein
LIPFDELVTDEYKIRVLAVARTTDEAAEGHCSKSTPRRKTT